MTAKPYEICWRNSTCSDGSECCLKNNSKLSVSDRNLTIFEVLNNQIYSCSLYLERCEECRTNLFGNVSYEINVFGELLEYNNTVLTEKIVYIYIYIYIIVCMYRGRETYGISHPKPKFPPPPKNLPIELLNQLQIIIATKA